MLDHPQIEIHKFEDIPLKRDLFLMDEKWLNAYQHILEIVLSGGDYGNVGYVSFAAVRSIHEDAIELSWYPNTHDRFHEVKVILPRLQFVTCIECREFDEKPHIFVRSSWLRQIHERSHSVFALVDAIGVKKALMNGMLSRQKLVSLREHIDSLAERCPGIACVSFADSLLLKNNWSVGHVDTDIEYTYRPETIVRLIPELQCIYQDVLQMNIYTIIAQGTNEYFDDELLHIAGNHISLNSLGSPFAQVLEIDIAARNAIRTGKHPRKEMYIDEDFFHSLQFTYEFSMKKHPLPKYPYHSPLSTEQGFYIAENVDTIIENLR